MGLFSKVKKSLSGITKNPFDLKNYADIGLQSISFGQIDTDGINGMGSFNDALLGKKAKDIKPDDIANQIRATQSKGISELNAALDTPSENIVKEQMDRQKKGVIAGVLDQRRAAQRSMARSGLSGSSLGVTADKTIARDATNSLAAIDAATPGAIRNQKISDATTRIGAGNVNQNGMNFHTIEGQRSGGLLGIASQLAPIAGTIGGMMAGGPAGAAAGGSIGSAMSGNAWTKKAVPGSYDDFYMNSVR